MYSSWGGGEKPGNKQLKVILYQVLEVDVGDRGSRRESALGYDCSGLVSLINAPLVYSQRGESQVVPPALHPSG